MADFTTGMGGGAYLQLSMQDTGASSVNWQLYLVQNNNNDSYELNPVSWSAIINGVGYGGTYTFDFRGSNKVKLIASGNTYVGGARAISGSGSTGATGTSIGGPASVGGSIGVVQVPGAPGISVASVVARTVSITVTAPGDNGGLTITAYTVQWSNDGGASWQGTTYGGSCTYQNLAPGSYIFRAYATNGRGNGPASQTGTVTLHSGGKVMEGGTEHAGIIKVRSGGTWHDAIVRVREGGVWHDAL